VLFDLQSPGRRRIIKVVYAILAALLAVGLVGFGIGSDATGGISEIFTGNSSTDTGYEEEIEDREKDAQENPRDPQAQLELITLYIQDGNAKLGVDEATGQTAVTAEAEESFNKAADAFAAYLALKPKQVDSGAALQMANAYFLMAQAPDQTLSDAIAQVENAAEAQQVAADTDPSRGNLNNLAYYLFIAGDFAAAERAAEQAIAKAPKGQQEQLRKNFDQLRQQGEQLQKQLKAEQKAIQQGQQGGGGENPLEGSGGTLGGGGALGAP
jgi:tetratricopeptide (TPR) repeat protein